MRVISICVLLATSSFVEGVSFLKSVKDLGRRLQNPSSDPCVENEGELLSIGSFYDAPFPKDKCTCDFANDLEGLDIDGEALGDPTGNDNFWNDLVNVVNSLLQNLNYQYSNSCSAAKCQCIGSACGTVAAKEKIAVQGSGGKYTEKTENQSVEFSHTAIDRRQLDLDGRVCLASCLARGNCPGVLERGTRRRRDVKCHCTGPSFWPILVHTECNPVLHKI